MYLSPSLKYELIMGLYRAYIQFILVLLMVQVYYWDEAIMCLVLKKLSKTLLQCLPRAP